MKRRLPIETERLLLRAPTLDDVRPLLERVFGDARAMRFIGDGAVRDEAKVRESTERKIACLEAHNVTLWTVVERDTGEIIGDCGICLIDWKGPGFELGYRLAPSAWGKGYATEAAEAALQDAWRHTALEEIEGVTHPDHAVSQRVLTKVGLRDRGLTDDHYGQTLRLFVATRPETSR